MAALVFDLGGTHLRCGIATSQGVHGLSTQPVESFLSGLRPHEVAQRIERQIMAYIGAAAHEVDDSDPVVLAFPGPVTGRRHALAAPTLYGNSIGPLPDIAGDLQLLTGRTVHLLNDVSAATWALSDRTAVRRFMVVTVSSGIGSKVFDRDSTLGVLDEPAFSGEIGHFVVDEAATAPVCDCGGRGHLGAIASGRGVERMARALLQNDSLTNVADIVPAILEHQPWAMNVLRQSMLPLARTLVAITMAIGLKKIFVIGGFAQSIGRQYAAMLTELAVADSRFPVVADVFNGLIEIVEADDSLALAGAARYLHALEAMK